MLSCWDAAVADSLFGRVEPIGKTVRMNGREYEVIGVFEKDPGMFGGPGVDQFAVIPFNLFRKQYPEAKELMSGLLGSEEWRLGESQGRSDRGYAARSPCEAQPG